MIITIEDVRIFLQDYPAVNRLLEKAEFNQERIIAAMVMTVDKYNMILPRIDNYTTETFPYKYLALIGVVAHLLRSEGLVSSKNRLQYSTGGNAIDDESKGQIYLQMSEKLNEEFLANSKELKIQKNISKGFGYVSSEYAFSYGKPNRII